MFLVATLVRRIGQRHCLPMERWQLTVYLISNVLVFMTLYLYHITLVMAALWNRAGHYIFVLWFLLSIFNLLFSSPILSCRRLDVYHTSTHGVALVQIQDAGLKRAACGLLKIQDAKNRQKFPI